MYIILVSHKFSGHSCPSSHMNLTNFQSKTDSNFEPTTSLEILKYMKGLVPMSSPSLPTPSLEKER